MSVEYLRARKGAFRIALIPPEVLAALNDGLLETVNLNEFLALDTPRLARAVAGRIGLDPAHERLVDTLAMLDVIVLDHMIVGRGHVYGFLEHGKM